MKKFVPIGALLLFMAAVASKDAEHSFDIKSLEKSLVLIPAGSFNYGLSSSFQFEPMLPSRSQEIEVASFYISNHEVSNGEYLSFLNDLKRTDTALYKQMLPDTLVWRSRIAYNEQFVTGYFRNHEFVEFPVVGISHQQALEYCNWLTKKYNSDSKGKFKHAKFKLPTKLQWTYAAAGGLKIPDFPWGSGTIQDKKGRWLANFTFIYQGDIGLTKTKVESRTGECVDRLTLVAESKKRMFVFNVGKVTDVFASVFTHKQNAYGLYNIAGNAEEMVMEEGISKGGSWNDTGYYLRVQAEEQYDVLKSASAERGFRVAMEIDAAN